MPIADQVKLLTEDIETAYGARIAAVSDIVKETRQTLGNFNREHQNMAGDLKRSLAANSSGRANEVHKLRAENTEQLKEMAKDLLSFLSSANSERKDEVVKLMNEIRGFIREVEKGSEERTDKVKDLLSNFSQEHQERAASLRGELSSFQRNLSSVVEDMRAVNSSDHRQARTHWQNLAKVMAAKRAGKSIPSPRAEMGVPEAVKEEAEEAFEEGEIKDRVLRVIQAHPGGIKLVEIGKVLGIAFIRATKPLQELLAEVKVTKRDKEYLPA